MKLKIHIDWRKIALFLLVSAGLVFLTRSLLMSIGILMLLFAVDQIIANWEYRRRTHKIFEDLRNGQKR